LIASHGGTIGLMPSSYRDRFRRALERKVAQIRSRRDTVYQPDVTARERPPGIPDPRLKSTGKGKKTADKWNQ
jgi:hypothetical protein